MTDEPLFKKQGFADLEFGLSFDAAGPEKTPSSFVARLNPDIVKAVRPLEGKAKLEVTGSSVIGPHPMICARNNSADMVEWGKVVAAGAFKSD